MISLIKEHKNNIVQKNSTYISKKPIYSPSSNIKSPIKPYANNGLLEVYFSGRSIKTKIEIAQKAKKELEQHIAKGTELSEKDMVWLKPLFKVLRTETSIAEINGSHCHPWSKQNFDHRKELLKTIDAVLGATNYNPIKRDFKSYALTVNNPEVNKHIKSTYCSESFSNLFELCDKRGTFSLMFDKNGFPITTNIGIDEDVVMRGNVWVTDVTRTLKLVKKKYPEKVKPILEKLSKFYSNETEEFKRVCKNPFIYANGYKINGNWQFFGVGHSFNPEILTADRKFMAVRLDSQGVFLQELSSTITSSLNGTEKLGIFSHKDINDDMVNSITMIGLYLKGIKFPYCTSCGNWENTMMHSITSDTEIVRAGLKGVQKIFKSKDAESLALQKRLEENYKRLKSEWKLPKYDYPEKTFKELVQNSINGANERLRQNYIVEDATDPTKFTDAALSFVPHTSVLINDTLKDVKKNLEILDSLKGLVGKNGIVRYERDAYENLNYELAIDSDGKFSFGDMKDRWTSTSPSKLKYKAEWFMVSDISKGYGVQLEKILKRVKKEKRTPNQDEMELIKRTLDGEVEHINRGYARVTGEGTVKSNGKPSSSWEVPESYMAVTSLKDIDKNEEKNYLPGMPLSWAKASLDDASEKMLSNLKMLEEMGISVNS